MKRRSATIRALAAFLAALIPAKSQERSSGTLTGTVFNGNQYAVLVLPDTITIEYRGKRAVLTAQEIMEALENK